MGVATPINTPHGKALRKIQFEPMSTSSFEAARLLQLHNDSTLGRIPLPAAGAAGGGGIAPALVGQSVGGGITIRGGSFQPKGNFKFR